MTKKRKPDPPRLRHWKCRQVYHVYQRGSHRQTVFENPAQLVLYLDRLDRLARRCKVRIHAFALMSNHVHFMFEPLRRGAISRLMQHLQSSHARFVNGLHQTVGHLWHHHFHAKLIKNNAQYCDTLLYIEKNPVVANMRKQAHLYAYSSAAAHVANEAIYRVRHRKFSAEVRLYLDRWRKEFQIPKAGPSLWANWLINPRQASHLQDILANIGKPPAAAKNLAEPASLPLAATARGS